MMGKYEVNTMQYRTGGRCRYFRGGCDLQGKDNNSYLISKD